MNPARVEPPMPLPARPAPSRAPAPERDAPAFDDVLRDQEAPAVSGKDAPAVKEDEHAPEESPGAAVAPPLALEALIAQAMAIQPARPRGETGRAPTASADRSAARLTAPATQVADAAMGADALALAEPDDLAPGAARALHGASGLHESFDAAAPSTARSGGPAQEQTSRASKREPDDALLPPSRSVAIRNVTSATHFAPQADPVRQIATEVSRALEAPVTGAPAETPAAPVKTVSLQLEPESLGAVTLRMRLSGAHLSVRVDVAEPATFDMLQRERDRLQKTMATESVLIESLDIRQATREAPVRSGDNADAPKQDMNAPGQQARDQRGSAQGSARGQDDRHSSQREAPRHHRQDHDSSRSGDSRGLYL